MTEHPGLTVKLECVGVTKEEAEKLAAAAGVELSSQGSSQTVRTGGELLTAAFILGVLNATPPLIKAIADTLADIRKSRYFTVKLTRDNGQTVVEGSVTPARLDEIIRSLEALKTQGATSTKQGGAP